MRTRTLGRELALKYLFRCDLTHRWDMDEFFEFGCDQEKNPAARAFAEELLEQIIERRDILRDRIEAAAKNWTWKRMATIDRELLLLGTHEILDRDDIPAGVTINEIVELAKRFGSAASAAFVNGILDSIRQGPPLESEGVTPPCSKD